MRYFFLATMSAAASLVAAQATAQSLTPSDVGAVTNRLSAALAQYPFPDKAAALRGMLADNAARYARLSQVDDLAKALTRDLLAASGDKHFSVHSINAGAPVPQPMGQVDSGIADGFVDARRLPGNIGYLKLRLFGRELRLLTQIDASLTLLGETDALIIDLRSNRGGSGESLQKLLGYVLGRAAPIQTLTWRQPDGSSRTIEERAAEPPTGTAYQQPVYVLTAARTASAAEAFAYALKGYRRAVLVGETTLGAANPSSGLTPLGLGLEAFVPNGLVESAITHTNWEGVGVEPDVTTPAADALVEAYRLALKALPERGGALARQRTTALENPRQTLEREFSL